MKRNVGLFLLLLVFIAIPKSLWANTLYFPHAVFGGGYSTTFVVTNTGTSLVATNVNFYAQSGSARTDLTVPISLSPGSSTRFTLPNTGGVTVVWAQIVAGAGTVQGVATFEFRDARGALITTAGVLGVEAGVNFLLPIDVVVSPRTDTGFAFANVSPVPVTVRLRLLTENGFETSVSTDARLSSVGARAQLAGYVTDFFPNLRGLSFSGMDPVAGHAVTEPQRRHDDRRDHDRPRHRDACEHEGRERLRQQQPDRDRRVARLRERPEQRDATEEPPHVLVGVHLVGERAEVGCELAGQRSPERDRDQERGRDERGAERRLQEVDDRAAGSERDRGARGESRRAEEQDAGDAPRSTSRTPIALYTQTSPASIAPRGPSRRSVNSSSRTGTSVPSTIRGAT